MEWLGQKCLTAVTPIVSLRRRAIKTAKYVAHWSTSERRTPAWYAHIWNLLIISFPVSVAPSSKIIYNGRWVVTSAIWRSIWRLLKCGWCSVILKLIVSHQCLSLLSCLLCILSSPFLRRRSFLNTFCRALQRLLELLLLSGMNIMQSYTLTYKRFLPNVNRLPAQA